MANGVILIVFGCVLVLVMIAVIIFYFSGKRKNAIEEPKFNMMKDDKEDNE